MTEHMETVEFGVIWGLLMIVFGAVEPNAGFARALVMTGVVCFCCSLMSANALGGGE